MMELDDDYESDDDDDADNDDDNEEVHGGKNIDEV